MTSKQPSPIRYKYWIYVLVFGGLLLISIIGVWYVRSRPDPAPPPTTTQDIVGVSYRGEDGKTPLELLQHYANDVDIRTEGDAAFVTSINGIQAPEGKQWIFWIDGQRVKKAANQYITSSQQDVEWRVE